MAIKPYIFVRTQSKALQGYGRKKKDGYLVPVIKRNLKIIQRNNLWDDIVDESLIPGPRVIKPPPENHRSYAGMYTFQRDALQQVLQSSLPGHLLYLSPGLGKTITAIVAAEVLQMPQVLIICTKRLMYMWVKEIQKWSKDGTNADIALWAGNADIRYAKWNIANVEMFSYGVTKKPNTSDDWWPASHFRRHWPLIIFDESILLQNRKTKRTQGMKAMSFDKLLLLSGNPTSRYFDDLWPQLHIIWPEAFSSYWQFARDVCVITENGFAKVITGNRDIALAEIYSDIIIRKTQEEELPDLPDYIFRERSLDLTPAQARAHESMTDDFVIELTNSPVPLEAVNKMSMLIRLQQVVSGMINVDPALHDSVKHDAVIEMINLQDTEYPMIIWVNWVPSARDLARKLREKFPLIRIGLAVGGEGEDIENYINGKLDIIVLSLGMGKFGHTMTDTKHVVYVDRTFDADAYIQSLARVKRIGLKHHPVMTVLRCPDSVETLVEDNLAGKLVGIAQLSNADLARLLRGIRRKRTENAHPIRA